MSADSGSESESPKKRGRIPQSAWPEILERYNGGVTLSAIAREFECTPSAISYIIKKAEAAAGQGELNVEPDAAPDAPAAETPVVETAPAPAVEAGTERAPATRPRQRLTRPADARADDAPAVAPQPAAPAPAAAPATETLRLNRPEPAPQPAPTVEAARPVAPAASAPTASSSAPAVGAPTTAPSASAPVDAVEGRLRDTAKACINAYRGWRQQPAEGTIQALSETVHELRKALSRIEIDMSASRREEQAIRPIPIPAHRASRRPQ